jgi:hypothetical protein
MTPQTHKDWTRRNSETYETWCGFVHYCRARPRNKAEIAQFIGPKWRFKLAKIFLLHHVTVLGAGADRTYQITGNR